ncbi:MAG TPA: glycosyltransferase [Gemmatimonadales bacterium]|nr:glycosyltransferase [Gemmatimonadales bacterium]
MSARAEPGAPTITAAICTAARPALLRRALASLAAQTPAPLELLVVDNGPAASRAATRAAVAEAAPAARYVVEPVPGLDFARNRALAEARGDVVAFLDDDAVAEPDWVGELARVFARDAVGACTGRVEAFALATPGQRLFEANGGFARGERRVVLPADAARPLHGRRAPLVAWAISVGSGASLAVRRVLALAIGGFDEALDLGPALPGGGDHDMLWRVLQAGAEVVYEPRVRARHEHRQELAAACDQIVGHQRALVALLTKMAATSRGRRRWAVLAFLAWRLAKPGARLARRLAGRDVLPAPVLLRMWWHCWRGLGAYPAARRLAAARRRAAAAPAPPLLEPAA